MNVNLGWWIIHLNPFIPLVGSNNARFKDLRWPLIALAGREAPSPSSWFDPFPGFMSLVAGAPFSVRECSGYLKWSLRMFPPKEQLFCQRISISKASAQRGTAPVSTWVETEKFIQSCSTVWAVIRFTCEPDVLVNWRVKIWYQSCNFVHFDETLSRMMLAILHIKANDAW